ncbi:GNAT family N-acetyltransferase [Streptomyces sp. KLOTTS4A1]|uniref:GNAT family N-acetyltransferase n=1 Tax=Streptomyces sp. KLOTTS4A1 TaxID=3390996 RepID=UPI0039F448AB
MPPTDASTDPQHVATATDSSTATPSTPSPEDTLDLRLPPEFLALCAAEDKAREDKAREDQAREDKTREDKTLEAAAPAPSPASPDSARMPAHTHPTDPVHGYPPLEDLLDGVSTWRAAATPLGAFQLTPARIDRDLDMISRWMNDPAVAEFWELDGAPSATAQHLHRQLEGDGRSVPCVGLLDGTPMSYWEIYRADLDPLARHYPARPNDTGIHLLIGGVADRGRGVGSTLLRAVADLVLDQRPSCARVVAEPDLRNTPSVSAFLSAGFRFGGELELPDKRAALMIRDRALRTRL